MNRFQSNLFITAILFASLLVGAGKAIAANSTLNQLLLDKSILEKQHGVKSLECFPFIKDIGNNKNQIPLIENCLKGVHSLKKALAQLPDADMQTVGISTRFLRTGGFHTVLVPWDASTGDMVEFLKKNKSKDEKEKFLEKIYALKRSIAQKIKIEDLYCGMEISNEQCLTGYQNLSAVDAGNSLKKMQWRDIVISNEHAPKKDPYTLALSYKSSHQEMLKHLQKDVNQIWSVKKRGYDNIQTQYGQAFKERLQSESFFCTPDLSPEECRQGALHLVQASENEVLQEKFWGRITIDRFNTLWQDDFHVTIRYDLPPAEIIRHFSQKPLAQGSHQKHHHGGKVGRQDQK